MGYKMKGFPKIQGTKDSKTIEGSKTVTVGENTSELKKDSKGNWYSLIMDDSKNFAAGDTIRPGNAPIIDNYIMGGDYTTKKKGNKNYEITGDVPPTKYVGTIGRVIKKGVKKVKDKITAYEKKKMEEALTRPHSYGGAKR